MQWYYAIGDQRQGPVDQAEFDRLVATGTIRGETLVWRQGMPAWQPYATVQAGTGGAPAVDDGTEACVVSGKRFPRREMINYEGKWISLEHRDAYFQRMREGISLPGEKVVPGPFGYGGFWRRFVAVFIDGIVQSVVTVPIALLMPLLIGRSTNTTAVVLTQVVVQVLLMAIGVLYDVIFIRKFDATPGKLAMGMKVLRSDGSKLSVGRIIGRHFAHFISALPIGIGYIVAAFDDEKRTFHDRICDTRMIKTR